MDRTITTADVRDLAREAGDAHDLEQVALCELALDCHVSETTLGLLSDRERERVTSLDQRLDEYARATWRGPRVSA